MPKIRFQTRIGFLSKLKLHYLEIPVRIVEKLGGGFKRRLVCIVNGKLKFQGGLVALGGGKAYVTFSLARMKKLDLRNGDSVTLEVTPDSSKFGMEYSKELRALLAQDREGKKKFEGLPPGKQRYIVYYVAQVKSTDRRLERAIFLIENLKRSISSNPTFREILGKGK